MVSGVEAGGRANSGAGWGSYVEDGGAAAHGSKKKPGMDPRAPSV